MEEAKIIQVEKQRILVTKGTLGSSINKITIVGAPQGGAIQVVKGLTSE